MRIWKILDEVAEGVQFVSEENKVEVFAMLLQEKTGLNFNPESVRRYVCSTQLR